MKHSMNKLAIMMKTLTLTSLVAAGAGAYGEDTEVFYSVNVSKPNLLFVLDVSGSMNTTVTGSDTPVPVPTPVSSGADDSFQDSGGNINSGTTVIDINQDNTPRFRFNGVSVPKDVQILDAYIQFTSAARDTRRFDIDVYMQDSANAPQVTAFSSADVFGPRRWRKDDDWNTGNRGSRQRAKNLTSMVQNVVNNEGWVSGNAMAFYLQNDERNRRVAGFEHPTLAPPVLHITYSNGKSRLEVMKESLRAVLEDAPDNVQVGLMNYGQSNLSSEVNNNNQERHRHHSVSGVAFPITDINKKANTVIESESDRYGLPSPSNTITIREYVADIADGWNASSYTPIVDALYEAALYYRGEKMHYGQRLPTAGGAHPKTHYGNPVTLDITDTSGSGRDNSTAQKYKTPIESSCQENYIVLMTDGAPTYRYRRSDGGWRSGAGPFANIRGGGQGPQGALASAITSCVTAAGVSTQGNCGAEITKYLAENDNLPDPTSTFPNGQEGEQYIGTYTIGFDVGTSTETYLKSLATIDDGNSSTNDDGYFPATSPADLAAAFADILAEVAAPKGTLASPGYSVNVKNGLEHENDIYIPVFDRKNSSRWAGNLKKFRIVDESDKRKIKSSNGKNAVNELGSFTNDALDYWSTSPADDPDGKVVQKGGLANLLNPAVRNIVSDVVNNNLSTDVRNKILDNNSSLTNSVLGLSGTATSDYRKKVINFMRGWENGDATSTDKAARHHMGDMLHSEPVVVTYDDGESEGTSGTKKQYIFAGTNEGYLHAFDTSDTGANAGKEMFAYIPSELLSTLSEHQYLNAGSQQDHKYGIDGSLTYRFFDEDGDGVVDPADDKVILYFGLRRGGSSYYALDVTNINQPKLLWKVAKSDDPANPLYRMGQSWSAPYLARVGVDDENSVCTISADIEKTHCKEVMIVTGGYDADDDRNEADSLSLDDATTAVTADVGNDVFIFDANDGSFVWSLPSVDKLKVTNSIPGGARILDTNGNKLIDRMYFGDTGGNVWRLDLSEKITATETESELNKLADVSSGGSQSRMFYNEPDVSTMKLNGKSKFVVSIGSGFRAHPLDKTLDDKFFMVVDHSPYGPLETEGEHAFSTTIKSDLAEITVSANGISQSGSIKDGKGWVVNLANTGEKVLATSVTVDGVVLFTTLVPEILDAGVGIDQCAAPATQGRLYAIDILSGGAANAPLGFDSEDYSGPEGTGIPPGGGGTFSTVSGGEIIGKPQTIFTKLEVNDTTGECKHPVDIRVGKKLSQATGYDACRLESVYWGDTEID